ncbi:unnamed protein product [Haemonchus placei]|uniref:Uncharacterized protein n=1 Tax=Haemonchus placei TaxID=6290 RepID=A0A3P7VFP0_HAEPC|nr:unnamed protein product [Haemonchus placei]
MNAYVAHAMNCGGQLMHKSVVLPGCGALGTKWSHCGKRGVAREGM